jgi:dTDP-4-amino-4,6-dideoxygalactose transaminase
MGIRKQINLFSTIKIDPISDFDHYLHGSVVHQYEEAFANYVGAKYACAANSESSLIFILFNHFVLSDNIKIPSILPPVVANAIINSRHKIRFVDNVDWVGNSYQLYPNVLDSAQEIQRNQYKNNNYDFILYSNYPTKPVAGIDGGVIVSNDNNFLNEIKGYLYNGTNMAINSWERKQVKVGWKMYMSTIQAAVALNSLKNIEEKKEKLTIIREKYNNSFSLVNTSDHLYRVKVENNSKTLEELKEKGIVCGIHYRPLHTQSLFNHYRTDVGKTFPLSEREGQTTLSIPFHEDLTDSDTDRIINEVSPWLI